MPAVAALHVTGINHESSPHVRVYCVLLLGWATVPKTWPTQFWQTLNEARHGSFLRTAQVLCSRGSHTWLLTSLG